LKRQDQKSLHNSKTTAFLKGLITILRIRQYFKSNSYIVKPLRQYIFIPSTDLHIQLFRYIIVGGTAAIIDWSLYWLIINIFMIGYLAAAFLSFTAATFYNYFLVINWVFYQKRFKRMTELLLVLLVSVIGLAINQLSLLFLIEYISFHYMWAKVLATGIVFFWNFSIRKYYIFRL